MFLGDAIVLISLTKSSMHKRNIAYYGLTTLRSTIAFNMLQLVKPDVGDVIIDPMCGCGAISIEVVYSNHDLKCVLDKDGKFIFFSF